MTTPPPSDPKPADPGASLEQRVGSLESEQQRQGGVLDQIWDKLKGDPKPADPVPPVVRGDNPPADMTEQMRQAVRDVNAEAAAAAAAAGGQPARPDPAISWAASTAPSTPATRRC